MSYIIKGWVCDKESIILTTDSIKDATIEWLSYEKDLKENTNNVNHRFDYIEFIKDEFVLESQHKIEECDCCGYHDVLFCQSDGCQYEN